MSLIGPTTSTSDSRVRSELGKGRYPDKVQKTDERTAQLKLERQKFHGDPNYTIRPHRKREK